MQSPPFPRYLVPPRSKYSQHHSYRKCFIGKDRGYNTDRYMGTSRLLLSLILPALTDTRRKYPLTISVVSYLGRNDRKLARCRFNTELLLITHYKHVHVLPLKWRKNCLTSPLSDQNTCFTFRRARFRSRPPDRNSLGFSLPSVLTRISQTVACTTPRLPAHSNPQLALILWSCATRVIYASDKVGETNSYKKTTINALLPKRIISEMNQYIPRKRVVTLQTSLPHQMQTGITKAFSQKCTILIQAGPYRSTACDPSPVNTCVEYTVKPKYKTALNVFLGTEDHWSSYLYYWAAISQANPSYYTALHQPLDCNAVMTWQVLRLRDLTLHRRKLSALYDSVRTAQ